MTVARESIAPRPVQEAFVSSVPQVAYGLERFLGGVGRVVALIREVVPAPRTTEKGRILRRIAQDNGNGFALRLLAEASRSAAQGRGDLQPTRTTKIWSNHSLKPKEVK